MVSETLMPGGAELFAVRLANALSAEHQVTIAVLHGERVHEAVERQVDPAVRIEGLRLVGKRGLWKVDGLLRRLRIDYSLIARLQQRWLTQIMRRSGAEIAHSHLVPADLVVERVKDDLSFAHVVTVHGDYLAYLNGATEPLFLSYQRKIEKVLGSVDRVITIATEQKRQLLKLFPRVASKMTRITNGYEPSQGPTEPDREALGLPRGLLIGMASRGVEKKGWASAIDAFSRAQIAGATLVLVGAGSYLERLAKDPLPPNVFLTGFVERPTDYIRHFDFCLLPSEFPHESLPTAIIDYLFCGKPVIATEVGEIRTMIEAPNGECAGILVKLDGTADVPALAEAMRQLAGDPAERMRLGAIALSAAAKFKMADCVERYEAVYRSLLK